jgi:hypothetical protein
MDPKAMRLYDKRIVERNIKKGLLSRKDYEKHLKSLEDIGDKGVYGGPLEDTDDDDVMENEVLEAEGAGEADVGGPQGEDEDEDEDEAPPSAPEGNSHSP